MTTPAATLAPAATAADQPQGFLVRIVGAAAFAHLLNDLIQPIWAKLSEKSLLSIG